MRYETVTVQVPSPTELKEPFLSFVGPKAAPQTKKRSNVKDIYNNNNNNKTKNNNNN